mgnify:CR=1 FL=1
MRIQRCQHDTAHAAADEIFHDLDLLVAIVFAEWAFPDDFNGDAVFLELRLRFERAGVKPEAAYVMGHAEYGYTANLPLADIMRDESMVVYEYEGEDIEPIHGGPVRLLIPNLYFWKSPKWLRGLELRETDAPGFWEQNGYHMYGDPFLEQRFWGD